MTHKNNEKIRSLDISIVGKVRRTMVKNIPRFLVNFLMHIVLPLVWEHKLKPMAIGCSNCRDYLSLVTAASANWRISFPTKTPKEWRRESGKMQRQVKNLSGNGPSIRSLTLWTKVHNLQR